MSTELAERIRNEIAAVNELHKDSNVTLLWDCLEVIEQMTRRPADDEVTRLRPWLQHSFSCLGQRDLHNDTVCRCGLDEAIASPADDEVTDAMIDAGCRAWMNTREDGLDSIDAVQIIYHQMRRAALATPNAQRSE